MRFAKYQALGNDYIVIDEEGLGALAPALVRTLCDRHLGLGADGILLVGPRREGRFAVRILNPDGSEAEKSGNGLRILARYLFDRREVAAAPFPVDTAGGEVVCRVERADAIAVEMGRVSFLSTEIPVAGPPREVIGERVLVAGRELCVTAASIGNPHCVVLEGPVTRERALELGPLLELHPLFPRRTNVQLLEVLDPGSLRIEIWERGAGYTLASGSSSCAAAAAAVRMGRCRSPVRVHMPGGALDVAVSADFRVTLRGPAEAVAEGVLAPELLDRAREAR